MNRNWYLSLTGCALVAILIAGCSEPQGPSAPVSEGPSYLTKLHNAPDHARIPGEYIVVLRDSEGDPAGVAADMERGHGLGVGHVYEHALKGFSAKIPDARLQKLLEDPRVAYIEEDQEVSIEAQSIPWGINTIGANLSSTISGNGAGTIDNVRVYIIDTGIQPNHPDLNVVGGINFTSKTASAYEDGNGHGTHCAGIAAARDNDSYVVGVAPGAPLYAVKVLGNSGKGSISGIVAGVNWVAGQKRANPGIDMVANMSLGGSISSSLDQAVLNCINDGVVVCVAAGNDGRLASNYSPARVADAITVGASDINNVFASWSNYGSVVDINAPGVSILSTYKGTTTKTMSGTSMATPYVTGAAALFLSTHPGTAPRIIRDSLVGSGIASIAVSRPSTTNKLLRVATY